MRNMYKDIKIISGAILGIAIIIATSSYANAALTASTSLTIVNVTSYLNGRTPTSITTWGGDWPQSSDVDHYDISGQEVYIPDVTITHHSLVWQTIPYLTPYPRFSNGLNSMICNVYATSTDAKNWELASWDYLAPNSSGKGLEEGMPECWIGTMVHSYCDFEAGACNGRNKSNLLFTPYPEGYTDCWGMKHIMAD